MDCVAIGDDIAIGIAAPLTCEVRAATNLTSSRIIQYANGTYHAYCVLSAGTFDPNSSKLSTNLMSIRNESNCKFYVWILPVNSTASKVVSSVAVKHSDYTVSFTPGIDGITPSSYNDLAGAILNKTNN